MYSVVQIALHLFMTLLKMNEDKLPTCRKIVGIVFVAIFRRALCDVVRRETLVKLLLLLLLLLSLLMLLLILLPLIAPLRVSRDIFGPILDIGIIAPEVRSKIGVLRGYFVNG